MRLFTGPKAGALEKGLRLLHTNAKISMVLAAMASFLSLFAGLSVLTGVATESDGDATVWIGASALFGLVGVGALLIMKATRSAGKRK